MNRRDYIIGLASVTAMSALRGAHAIPSNIQSAEISVDPRRTGNKIPVDFMGLGYEISSVAVRGLLHPENRAYVQMVRTLSPRGVIRIGGNTSDYAAWSPNGERVAAPKSTAVNEASIRDLAGFLRAIGWTLIWGLNLGGSREDEVMEEARAVAGSVGTQFVKFEIGNEPDLFPPVHRAPGYGFQQWSEQYRHYAARIAKTVPGAVFAGPDVAGHTDWVARFADNKPENVRLLTHHYYAEGPPHSPASTIENLLQTDPKLKKMLTQLQAISRTSALPYRICETNSCFGGGKPGVSDTFASALWGLDYMFTLAEANAEGLNMETGLNQLGFVSSYSPIVSNDNGGCAARPLYYGMLAFAQASRGRILELDYTAGTTNTSAHAVVEDDGAISLTLINKNAAPDLEARISLPKSFHAARAYTLTAPSLESKTGVTLGKAEVSDQGFWKAAKQFMRPIRDGKLEIMVPVASALLVKLSAE